MLPIIEYIKKNGLQQTVDNFKLKVKEYPTKLILKYDQIESPMNKLEVQDCRGLILDKNNFDILCYSFRKFFNYGETNASNIDWNSALVLDKLDGSMIQLYYDWTTNNWFPATTGTAEGEGEVNSVAGTTFFNLFWATIKNKVNNIDEFKSKLNKDFVYVFELMTPYNIVVTPHKKSNVVLLAVRNLRTLKELNYTQIIDISNALNISYVGLNKLKDIDNIKKSLVDKDWFEEGYIVIDKDFNRVKVKNPAYVAAHHLKSKMALHHIIEIIKTNEVDEFIATFEERRDEILLLKDEYNRIINKLDNVWSKLINYIPDDTKESRKQFALQVFRICEMENISTLNSVFFKMAKINSSIRDIFNEFDNKFIYNLLIKTN